MGAQYRVRHLFIRFGLLVAASGSMATSLDAVGGQWRIGFGLAIAVLIAADFMLDYATKIAVLSSTKRECDVLEAEWRELWLDVDSPESTDAEIRAPQPGARPAVRAGDLTHGRTGSGQPAGRTCGAQGLPSR